MNFYKTHFNVNPTIVEYVESLDMLSEDVLQRSVYLDYDSTLLPQYFTDIQGILSESKESGCSFLLRNALIETVFKADKKCAYGGFFVYMFFVEFLKKMIKLKTLGTPWDINIPDISRMMSLQSRFANKDIIKKFIKTYIQDSDISLIINETLLLGGMDAQVHINEKPKDVVCLELISGNKFKINAHPLFINSGKVKKWDRENVTVVIIDGLIEKVSEIDKILAAASELKKPVVFFCRGYSDDVANTLMVNFVKETLDVIPVVVPYDLVGSNMLKDIAVCCNTDVVSSLKGQLISAIKFEDCPNISGLSIEGNNVIIRHPNASVGVRSHMRYLIKKLENEINPEKTNLLSDRITTLSSRCVTISLNDYDKNRLKLKTLRIGGGIKMINEVAHNGYIDISLLYKKDELDIHIKNVLSKLIKNNITIVPAPSLINGMIDAYSLSSTVANSGAYLTID